jgi:hypothetical protein
MSDQSPVEQMMCPKCGKAIETIEDAIASVNGGTPMHFDCVLLEIAQGETLEADDKVVYLGAGSFGVVSLRPAGSPIPFIVKKRIQYESKDDRPVWRKDIVRSMVREDLPHSGQ